MKQRVFLLSCLLAFAFAAMAQIDTGKWYRVKDVGTGLYFTALNHEKHEGAVGGVAVAEKEQDNLEQVFRLEDAGGGFYKLQTLTGYNVCFSRWNVDALDQEASLIKMVEVETDVYQFKNGDAFFKVENVGGTYYPFNDGAEAVAAKFQLEDAGNDNFKVGNEVYYLDPVLDEAGLSYFVTEPTGSYTVPSNVQVGLRNFTVNKVMNQAFIDTPGLTEVTIPNTVTEIQDQAFWNCKDLETVNLPESLEKIDQWAFQYCTGLKNITLPSSLTTIGNGAFFGSGLEQIHIPASVTSIGQGVLADCDALEYITVDENNPVYDSRKQKLWGEEFTSRAIIETASNTLIAGCKHTSIPYDVTTIGKNAFQGLDGVTWITLPPSVTAIEHWAFADCANLNTFIVHGTAAPTLATDSSYPFEGCSALTEIYVRPGTAESYTGGWENFSIQEIQNPYPVGNVWYELDFDNATAVVVAHPDGEYTGDIDIWTNFASSACGSFKVNRIRRYAFYGSNLTSLTIGAGIREIGDHAFWGVNGVEEVVLPESVEYIGDGAFGCSGFSTINVPAGVTHIGTAAFTGCRNLTALNVHEDNANYCNVGANLFSKDKTWLYSVSAATVGEYVIPSSVANVQNYCFENCSGLTKIVVPEGVGWPTDATGECHFNDCPASFEVTQYGINYAIADIKADDASASVAALRPEYGPADYEGVVEVPEVMSFYSRSYPVKAIGDGAFADCNDGVGLTGVVLPNTIESIGQNAFTNSHYLPEVNIPASVTSIGLNAFFDCISLTAINVAEENTAYCSIDGVLFDKEATTLIRFPKNKPATIYNMPNTVTAIADWAFARCTALNGVVLSNSLQTIGNWAFWFTHINQLVIPASVTEIGDYAFQSDSDNPEEPEIQELIMLGTTPPAANGSFYGADDLTTIYVPAGAEAAYSVAPWNHYIIKSMPYPVDGKYYILRSRLADNWVAYENANHQIGLQKGWTTPDAWTVKDHAPAIWKAQVEGEKVVLQNFHSQRAMKTHPHLYNAYTTVESDPSSFTMTYQGDYFFTLFDEELATTTAYMHADTTYSKVVRWDGKNLENHGWEFVEVPADVVEALLAQKQLNKTLADKTYALTRYEFFSDPNYPTDHGLIRSASQLSTNKQETTEGPIAALLDGDPKTFFHSTWMQNNSDNEVHYLQVDLGQEYNDLSIELVRRYLDTSHNDAPKRIRILATNDPASGEWEECFNLDLEYDDYAFGEANVSTSFSIGHYKKYRYWRFYVDETVDGRVTNNNLFFSLTEFGIWDMSRYTEFEEGLSSDQKNEIHTAISVAMEELQNEAATQATIDRINACVKLINGLVVLTDGQTYTNDVEQEASRITYTRNFKNTNWQAWYVPFDVAYDDISDEFTVARINGIHEYDDNNDGEFDRWTVEVLKLRPGATVYANLPYVIRANAKVNKQFAVENTTLYPADEQSVDCSTTTVLYTFKGVYSPMAGTVLRENGWFAMGGGGLVTPTASSTLNPNRWYLAPTARGGYAEYYTPKRIEIEVGNEDGDVTGIEGTELLNDNGVAWPADVYDLNGRLVKAQAENLDDLPKGVYVVDGQKVVK